MTKNAISDHLKQIHQKIRQACLKAQRPEESVSLVAVSKFHPIDSVKEALEAGQRLFGENRVQEAAEKFPLLRKDWPDLRLHIIGGLQTNKALEACRLADVIETLDRPALSEALDKAAQKLGRLPDLLIQVNTGDEPQKSGIARDDADQFIEASMKHFGPSIKGLMAIPPVHEPSGPHFRLLAEMARRHGLETVSMGMSADFEAAIAEGATMVRVGSAIFGTRPVKEPHQV
ncbi:YggS family pyridoxal phosphate-dependent enzyme [Acetobacteraceae bacterium ESL0709]|nr:YggS family pyridoxal phosphate-dependent enzyme [Acetobacteraceae bacterium ESL0697]MDF7677500.1 YggS family pyridoxal phosphate-dependent enzyme [Acetobacteraceae bacterium ESL0709]